MRSPFSAFLQVAGVSRLLVALIVLYGIAFPRLQLLAQDPQTPRSLLVNTQHSGLLLQLLLSDDGAYAISAGTDDQVAIFDPRRGLQVWTLTSFVTLNGAAFQPFTHTFAIGQKDGTALLINPDSHETTTLQCTVSDITSLSFSHDGHHLACGDIHGNIGLADFSSPNHPTVSPLASLSPDNLISSLHFSSDDKSLTSSLWGDKAFAVDVATHAVVPICLSSGLKISAVTVTSSGTTVAAGARPTVGKINSDFVVFDCTNNREISHDNNAVSGLPGWVSVSADGNYVAASLDHAGGIGTVKVWNLRDASQHNLTVPHTSLLGPVAVTSHGQSYFSDVFNHTYLSSALNDTSIRRIDESPVEQIKNIRVIAGNTLFITRTNIASRWNLRTGDRTGYSLQSATISMNGKYLGYISTDSHVHIYDLAADVDRDIRISAPPAASLELSNDGNSLLWKASEIVSFVSAGRGRTQVEPICASDPIIAPRFEASSNVFVVACTIKSGAELRVVTASTLTADRTIQIQGVLVSFCLSKQGTQLAYSTLDGVYLVDLTKPVPPQRHVSTSGSIYYRTVSFSDDSSDIYLARYSVSDFALRVLHLADDTISLSIASPADIVSLDYNDHFVFMGLINGTVAIIDRTTNKVTLTLLDSDKDDWLAIDEHYRFDGTAQSFRWTSWRVGDKFAPLESYFTDFYQPGLVFDTLNGEAEVSSNVALNTTSFSHLGSASGQAVPVTSQPAASPRIHLLAVGISQYPPGSGLSTIDYAVSDAKDFANGIEQLSSPPHLPRITGLLQPFPLQSWQLLKDGAAQKKAILSRMQQISQDANENDIVVLYLSGHGYVPRSEEMFYFEPVDVSGLTLTEQRENAISTAELGDFVRGLRAKRVLLVIDACQAGAASPSLKKIADVKIAIEAIRSRLDPQQRTLPAAGVAIIFAASPSEEAFSSSDFRHSLLTEALLESIKTKDATKLSSATLIAYVRNRLPEMTAQSGVSQSPIFVSEGSVVPLAMSTRP